jgi:hypothetical protein
MLKNCYVLRIAARLFQHNRPGAGGSRIALKRTFTGSRKHKSLHHDTMMVLPGIDQ